MLTKMNLEIRDVSNPLKVGQIQCSKKNGTC